jgi:glycosyltransferase involved in cell wall biosynthesis
MGDELSKITQMIQMLGLSQVVKITGTLPQKEKHTLYAHANGWIATGPYYAGGANIELARAYELPLLLANIKSLDGYGGIKIHPNHTEHIPEALKKLESYIPIQQQIFEESMFIRAYEKCLMK